MQRVFDVENEKDMQDLFDILPDEVESIEKYPFSVDGPIAGFCITSAVAFKYVKINWHDKTEITRPIQEATEADIGKLCVFWDLEQGVFGKGTMYCTVLEKIDNNAKNYRYIGRAFDTGFLHCRRLTKQEIEELV